MPSIAFNDGSNPVTFGTQAELDAFVTNLRDSADRGDSFQITDDNGVVIHFLPGGTVITQPAPVAEP